MEEHKKLADINNVIETAELLLACRLDYQKTINVIVENALRISGADRACLIISNKKDELIIKAGSPQNAHGVGKKIRPETGEMFLRQVMSNESIVFIAHPSEDRRVSYMREFVTTCGISSISRKLESVVNDVLTYSSLKKPVLETYSINEFLKEELSNLFSNGPKPLLKLSKRLNGINMAFDKKMLSMCITDLVRYAAEASASRIVIKTKLEPKQKEITIFQSL
jgi:transcriptional regulator with GAF, ATPase, and Fis domain